MAESLHDELLDELSVLDLSKKKVKKVREAKNSDSSDSSSEDEGEAYVAQEFFREFDPRQKVIPVTVTSILSPSRFVLKFQESVTKRTNFDLAPIYEDLKWKQTVSQEKREAEKVVGGKKTSVELDIFATNKYVIVDTGLREKAADDDEVDSSDEEDRVQLDDHSTGVIMSHSPRGRTYQVFVCNLGTISTFTEFELCSIPPGQEYLLENPAHVLLTIPGLVPRKRVDHIPGLSQMNIQDRSWSKDARADVTTWLSKYKNILLRELIQEGPCLYLGDLYGSNETDVKANNAPEVNAPEVNAPEVNAPEVNAPEVNAPEVNAPEVNAPEVNKDDNLTSYLTKEKNAFIDYALLNRLYVTLK